MIQKEEIVKKENITRDKMYVVYEYDTLYDVHHTIYTVHCTLYTVQVRQKKIRNIPHVFCVTIFRKIVFFSSNEQIKAIFFKSLKQFSMYKFSSTGFFFPEYFFQNFS